MPPARLHPRTELPGPAIEMETMGAHGATFTALAGGRRYILAAEIDSEWVIVSARP